MAEQPKTKSDILLEMFGGRFVGGAISQLANYSDLFLRMSEAVFLLDQHSYRVLECNPSGITLLNKEESEILGHVFPELFPGVAVDLEKGLAARTSLALNFKGQDGRLSYYKLSATSLKILDYIEVIQVVVDDVTDVTRAELELKEANAVLKKLSTTDEMTGLWNFRFFKESLEQAHQIALSQSQSYGIVFMDVDHFKKFNDRNGHPAGDQVLRQVASILKASVAPHQFAARYGGEEFVVLSQNSTRSEVLALAETIREKIASSPFPFGEFQPLGKVSISVGVALFPLHGEQVSDILHHADLALYHSKEQGRNRVTEFSETLTKLKESKKAA